MNPNKMDAQIMFNQKGYAIMNCSWNTEKTMAL